MFAYSCKQANNGGEQNPTTSDDVTITIQGDEGVIVNKLNTIKVKKSLNLTWKDIKQKAVEKITTKENKEIKEWRLKDAKGAVLKNTDIFEKDEIVWCVSKNKEKPPTNPITITIEVDEGYTFKETTKPCTIEVQKGSAWSSIKEKAEGNIELKDGYEVTGWKFGGKDGSYIEDTHVFNANASVYATSKKKGEPDKPKVTITVKGDKDVEVGSPNDFTVDSGSKWGDIKTQAEEKAKAKENFEIKEWHLNNKDGTVIKDETEFKGNTTIFAVSKRKVVQYKVEHLQENIENDEFTVKETEEKTGEAGKNTLAETKEYEGFSCQGLAQAIIKADGTTVIQIKYKRNCVSLILDLAGGKTTPALEDGSDGKKLLKGKFGARVEVKGLAKENHGFEKWEPALPKTFPITNLTTVYVAKWKRESVTITVKGDVGIATTNPNTVSIAKGAKWVEVKAQVMAMAIPKEDLEIKEWRINYVYGELIEDNKVFKTNTTIFAVSKKQQITITVKGDDGIEVGKTNIFTIDKGSKWASIRLQGQNKIKIKKYFDFREWRIDNPNGELIGDNKVFKTNTTIFAVSERHQITITVKAGSSTSYYYGTVTYPNHFSIGKGLRWVDIKEKAIGMVKPEENFIISEWHLDYERGILIEDDTIFKEDTTVFACIERQEMTITVIGNEKVDISTPNTVTVGKGSKWYQIEEYVNRKVTVKEKFYVPEWHLNNADGMLLTNEFVIRENITVFANIKRGEINIRVTGNTEGIDISPSNIFTVYKGSKWKDIKEQTMSKIKVKENFELSGDWNYYYEGKDGGGPLEDETVLEENSIVYPILKTIKITVKCGEGIRYYDSNYTSTTELKGCEWTYELYRSIKRLGYVEGNFGIGECHLDSENGRVLKVGMILIN